MDLTSKEKRIINKNNLRKMWKLIKGHKKQTLICAYKDCNKEFTTSDGQIKYYCCRKHRTMARSIKGQKKYKKEL